MKLRQEKLDKTRFCRSSLLHGKQNWYQDMPGTLNVQK